MTHEKTVIYFNSKGKSYRVEYDYSNTIEREILLEKQNNDNITYLLDSDVLQARVYANNECIRLFNPLPYTKTNNSTKTQARELIKIALKDIKQKQKILKNV